MSQEESGGKLKLPEANAQSARANQSAMRQLRVHVFPMQKQVPKPGDEPGRSKELTDDPWETLTSQGKIIEPPFDMLTLAMLPETNSELTPCLESMEENVEGFGHRFLCRVNLKEADEALKKNVLEERVRLENFFQYASRESFIELRKRRRTDLESTGNAYFEVIRSVKKDVQGLNHIPSYQMRLGQMEKNDIKVKVPILELQPDGQSFKVTEIPTWRKFRMFIQSRFIMRSNLSYVGSYSNRWFKEFGDPREYHCETGEMVRDENGKWVDNKEVPEEKLANEIVHFKRYAPRTPYGLPRFIGNLLAIFGDRAAEEINYVTFRNNQIPSLMLLVSNGQLTQDSINRIKEYIQTQIQGNDNYSKVLVVEAEGLMEGEEGGQVKMQLERLQSQQRGDALFQNYSKGNQERIRGCFRLPPIMVGRTEDYTRATAETSRRLADEQVFAPERQKFDDWVNRELFPVMGIIYHKFKSNSPNTTDNTELVKILSGAEKTGAMTPRIGRKIMEDILSDELPPFPDDFPADVPFSMTMAEAVKNLADPTEPGQQVTALKTIRMLTGEGEEGEEVYLAECTKCGTQNIVKGEDLSDEKVLDSLVRMRKKYEAEWRREADLPEPHEHEEDEGD